MTPAFHLLGNASPGGGEVVAVAAARAVEVDEPHVVALCGYTALGSLYIYLLFFYKFFIYFYGLEECHLSLT